MEQFWPNFWATIIGVVSAGYLSFKLIQYQLNKQAKDNYASSIKSVFSEIQDNERVFRQGKSFKLNFKGIGEYELLLVLLNKTILSGALSSERLGHFANHKLISSLTALERRTDMHNLMVSQVMNMISANWNIQKKPVFDWLDKNLKDKQKTLKSDYKDIMPVLLAEIQLCSKKRKFRHYFKNNKKVEKIISKK